MTADEQTPQRFLAGGLDGIEPIRQHRRQVSAIPRLLLLAAGILLLWIDYWLLPVALSLIAAAWLYQRFVGARAGADGKAAAE